MITGQVYSPLLPPVLVQPGRFMTRAVQLMNMDQALAGQDIDPDLALLVVNCLADSRDRRPDLEDLFNQVFEGMQRPATNYANPERESDQSIVQLIHTVLHQAPGP
ncbi:uncharacterized protein PG998_009959 [Apiospora kogelbergensis]|uniref:uncharacterized protein n=1 Tax=Apiospora kogelbergensis TaxID=1337665 RepID=UPI00312D3BD3